MFNAFKVSITSRIDIMTYMNAKQYHRVFDQNLVPHYQFSYGFVYDTIVIDADSDNQLSLGSDDSNDGKLMMIASPESAALSPEFRQNYPITIAAPKTTTTTVPDNVSKNQQKSKIVPKGNVLTTTSETTTTTTSIATALSQSTSSSGSSDHNLNSPLSANFVRTSSNHHYGEEEQEEQQQPKVNNNSRSKPTLTLHTSPTPSTTTHQLPLGVVQFNTAQNRYQNPQSQQQSQSQSSPHDYQSNLTAAATTMSTNQSSSPTPTTLQAVATDMTKLLKLQLPGRIYHMVARDRITSRKLLTQQYRRIKRQEERLSKELEEMNANSNRNQQQQSPEDIFKINRNHQGGAGHNSNSIQASNNSNSNHLSFNGPNTNFYVYESDSDDDDDDDDAVYEEDESGKLASVCWLLISIFTCFICTPPRRYRTRQRVVNSAKKTNNNNNNNNQKKTENKSTTTTSVTNQSSSNTQNNTANTLPTSASSFDLFETATQDPSTFNSDSKYLVFPAHHSMFEEMSVSKSMWSDHMPINYDLTDPKVFSVPYNFLRIKRF